MGTNPLTTVIDVGCARHGPFYSVERLIDTYHPRYLVGYDPADISDAYPDDWQGTQIWLAQYAAWTHDGYVTFDGEAQLGHVSDNGGRQVPCVDLARVILEYEHDGDIILKLDCEGAEYDLLQHLLDTKAANRLTGLLVEWHARDNGRNWRRNLIRRLQRRNLPVEEWVW